MPFQLSPGIQVLEKDFTTVVPAVSVSNGAICGPFTWGPIEDPIRIASENELVSIFGKPTSANFSPWFTASNFLSYSNNLLVTRTDSNSKNAVSTRSAGILSTDVKTSAKGTGYADDAVIPLTFSAPLLGGGVTAVGTATWDGNTSGVGSWTITITNAGSGYVLKADGTPDVTISVPTAPGGGTAPSFYVEKLELSGVKIKNLDHYLTGFANETSTYGLFAAKFAGTKGNGLKVMLIDYGNWEATPTIVRQKFSKRPETSSYAALKGIAHDEVHMAVYDTPEGAFSGTPNALLETFEFMSKLSDAKRDDGTSNFYKNVINNNSKYLWHLRVPGSNVFSEFLTSTGNAAGEGPDGSYLVYNATSGIQFFATGSKISITDSSKFSFLSAFKSFYDNAPDKTSRQLLITGTQSNNFAYTIVSVVAVTSGSPATVTGYDITVLENVIDETVSSSVNPVSVRSLIKLGWGNSSEAFSTYAGNNFLPVLRKDGAFASGFLSVLSGGVEDLTVNASQYQNAYALLASQELYDVSLLPLPNVAANVAQWVVNNVAEIRKDCVVFISPNDALTGATGGPLTNALTMVNDIKAFRDATGLNTSYAVIDSGFKYMYDRYNDVYRWVPLSGDVAGLCARTDFTADPWYSPGGFNRGVIKNIIKLAFNPNQTQRDDLYVNGINPVVTFRGQGTVLYGDKTMLAKPSAFDRINVRRLFIVLEKAIAVASRSQLFEFNDAFTRAQFKNLVEPFLRDVQGRRGVTDFRVVCDETNNTGEVIDRNEFVADIYIKPNRSINFITLSFIAARSSISFEEIGA